MTQLRNCCSKKGVIDLTKVTIKQNESPEELIRRFRKKVMRSGRLAAARQKRWFVSKSEVRRIEKKKAIRRLRRKQRPSGRVTYDASMRRPLQAKAHKVRIASNGRKRRKD